MEATVDRSWRKSSYSGNGGQCIEVANDASRIFVRDSKDNQTGPTLKFSSAAWRQFASKVKADASLASDSRPTL